MLDEVLDKGFRLLLIELMGSKFVEMKKLGNNEASWM